MDLIIERQELIQRCINLTTGADLRRIQNNIELLKNAVEKIESQTDSLTLKNYAGQFAPVFMHLNS